MSLGRSPAERWNSQPSPLSVSANTLFMPGSLSQRWGRDWTARRSSPRRVASWNHPYHIRDPSSIGVWTTIIVIFKDLRRTSGPLHTTPSCGWSRFLPAQNMYDRKLGEVHCLLSYLRTPQHIDRQGEARITRRAITTKKLPLGSYDTIDLVWRCRMVVYVDTPHVI